MERWIKLALCTFTVACLSQTSAKEGETILSTVLTPDTKEKTLSRQSRSYYDQRYASVYGGRPYYGAVPLYDRLQYAGPEYNEPTRCGRCYDDRDRYDDRDGYDRPSRDRYDNDKQDRDRYDNDRRVNHRPTYGNRQDKNNYNDDDDRKFNDQKNKNGTDQADDDKKRPYDDKDKDRSSENGRRDKDRRPDDRDRYRPDYYDRFLRDRPYEDPYRARRPLYDRNPYQDRYDDGYGGRYEGYGYSGARRPVYDDRYDRGTGYDDIYGGYGPGVGRGSHDSFKPWDETYRGQAGWDAGGRGYYFASGRPEAAPAPAAGGGGWGRPEYARPETSSGWQSVHRDPLEYRGSVGYGESGYRQGFDSGYGQASGWQSVRPYRDQSGIPRDPHNQPSRDRYGQNSNRQGNYNQQESYGQGNYGQQGSYGQGKYGQQNSQGNTANSNTLSSSTTQQTSYLYQREDDKVTTKPEETTKTPS